MCVDRHTNTTALPRNDGGGGSKAHDDSGLFFQQDSRSCGGAVVALRIMVKVSDLGDRAFAIMRNTAALLTQG